MSYQATVWSVAIVRRDDRLVHQAGNQVEHVVPRDAVARADLLRCPPGRSRRRRPTTAPTASARPGSTGRNSSRSLRPAPAAWPVAAGLPPVSSRKRSSSRSRICDERQRPHPDRRELESQRYAVQPPAHLDHLSPVGLVDHELRHHRADAIGEENQGLVLVGVGGRHLGRRRRQRWHRQDLLTFDAEHVPAGGQDPQLRCGRQQLAHQYGARLGHLLTVVEHQQQVLVLQVLGQVGRRVRPTPGSARALRPGCVRAGQGPAGRPVRRTRLRRGTSVVPLPPSGAPGGSCRLP